MYSYNFYLYVANIYFILFTKQIIFINNIYSKQYDRIIIKILKMWMLRCLKAIFQIYLLLLKCKGNK